MEKRGRIGINRISLIVLIAIVLIFTIFVTFFYTKKCSDISCFNSYLGNCRRAEFYDNSENALWYYKILGKSSNPKFNETGKECVVYVRLIEAKKGSLDLLKAQGKDMTCNLPYSAVVVPHSSIDRCHGLLKEELQDIIIRRIYAYITSNIGEIGEELTKTI